MADTSERNENDIEMMEKEDDLDDDSDESSSEDEEDNEAELQKKSESLQKQLDENPYMYNNHVELIKTLRAAGDFEKLRAARQKMSELFPLSEEIWLEWLQDEMGLVTNDDERDSVFRLFERAVKDYLSIPVWLEYVQFSIGGMGKEDGVQKAREVFDRALTACGLHVTKGANLWEAYREFENALLAGLMPAPGREPTKQQEDKFSEQHDRVQALFKRQLTVPLYDMKETYKEYKEWLQDEPDSYTRQQYNRALTKLEKVRPYEGNLASADAPRLAEYQDYLQYEEKEGDPARIQCLYERAVQENCLTPTLWLQYTKYLDSTLKVSAVSLPVYERSVRNCPWCVQLWQNYILLLERDGQPYNKVKEVFEAGLLSGFSLGSEYLLLWTTFIDYLRRRIKWDEDHEEDLDLFRMSIEKAIEQIDTYGAEGDPNCMLRQFWANIEAKLCKNLEKGRELWAEIMTLGSANEAALWMEHYRFERMYGDNKHCRRVLQRALNSVTDWPESIVDAYINFEREEGTLEQYDLAVSKCEAQISRVRERREKESQAQEASKKPDKKGQKRGDNRQQGRQKNQNKPYPQKHTNKQDSGELETNIQRYKRKNKPSALDEEKATAGFKVPTGLPAKAASPSKSNGQVATHHGSKGQTEKSAPPPGFKGQTEKSAPPPGFKGQTEKSAPPPGFKGQTEKSAPPPGFKGQTKKSAPPPGFKGQSSAPPPGYKSNQEIEDQEEPPTKKMRTEEAAVSRPANVASKTVFISNLSFDVDEDEIRAFFEKCGQIDEVRLVKNFKGKSKGYAYLQFSDQIAVMKALTYDRTPIKNRPMYVSKYEERTDKGKADFKYSTDMEKNKLFVKNLPFTCTKEALETLFGQHGDLKSVRLVTYKSGQPKGLAYIEYNNEQDASQAVLKTDGLMVGEHAISVAISNPPVRRQPLGARDEDKFTPTLGGGKKETLNRGVARTQVMLMPRAVAKKGPPASKPSPGVTQGEQKMDTSDPGAAGEASKKTGMSNSDFRNMLLKK